ncbi:DUF4321 domain-containing protein [candidate division KSB1 bacterium]
MRHVSFRLVVVYLVLGAVIGSFLGEFVAWLLPAGVVKDFFLLGVEVGIDNPVMLNLRIITVTFGFSVKFNIAGLIGLLFAVYILRWYR